MSIKKVGGKRNFGFGRSLKYAADCALRDKYGSGRFGNRHTLLARIRIFISFMRENFLSDYRQVTPRILVAYAETLRRQVDRGELSTNTAVNYLSAVNCLFSSFRSDRQIWISPRNSIGARSFVRTDIPEGLDPAAIEAAALRLESANEFRIAGVLRLCRVFGLRFREASLLPFRSAFKEAKRHGVISVSHGTKGGRIRTVPACADALTVLQALTIRFPQARNLIPDGWTYIRWSRYCYRTWRQYATEFGVTCKFSDLRAAFACSVYESETGTSAPLVTGGRTIERAVDRHAREVVAQALGHGREQIAGAYVGTTVKK